MVHHYHEEILEALARHGVRPAPSTSPAFVRDFLNDLYRYEIRRLRERLLRQEFPKPEYAGRVDTLRRTYPLLSLDIRFWTK